MIFRKICALLSRKPIEAKLPDFPVDVPAKPKKPAVKKATARKPAVKKTVAKIATKVAKKPTTKKK